MKSPFPYFGGKSRVAKLVWQRFGRVKNYIEPFCGSAAMLLNAPRQANLEVICDLNLYIANFWRAVKYQPDATWAEADYPVSHIDQSARHWWLTDPERVADLQDRLLDPEWPGDPRIAGWWLWGQCSWIGKGWCDKITGRRLGPIPHISNIGMGVQSTSGGAQLVAELSARLERVRVLHGAWDRCVNTRYGLEGGGICAVFLDPPYRGFERLYSKQVPVAAHCEAWCRETEQDRLRVALCGHIGDYDLPGWDVVRWSRVRSTYNSTKTKNQEAIWFSPACLKEETNTKRIFSRVG